MNQKQSLAEQYRCQSAWRDWDAMLDMLPLRPGEQVLDLGCAIGDQSALLAARGVSVIGIDANGELLDVAQRSEIAGAEFRVGDIRELPTELMADGIWCSFAAAYLPNLEATVGAWRANLRPGGWIALVEVDDLFAHSPISPRTSELFEEYVVEARRRRVYDFRCGRKIPTALKNNGFELLAVESVPDRELAFEGPADTDVLDAWSSRLDRLGRLRELAGPRFEDVREDFLACLSSPSHETSARVMFCVATKTEDSLP